MCDENPYTLPKVDEEEWFKGGHLGTQTQSHNWQIVNITTPANYFHALRRQVSGGPGDAAQLMDSDRSNPVPNPARFLPQL
jgi:2-oxoglutarate dehydrogenase complex dehydrogenase (E1) component-like enzyme